MNVTALQNFQINQIRERKQELNATTLPTTEKETQIVGA